MWTEQPRAELIDLDGKHVAAPDVVCEDGMLHMLVQTEYMDIGGTIEYLVSSDGGNTFERVDTAFDSIPGTDEAALYDPHPAIINGKKYFTYSGSDFIAPNEGVDPDKDSSIPF